jgi:predicted nuclease with TOPRIM domain
MMEGGQLMVVMIVAIVMIASIIKARVKWNHQSPVNDQMLGENKRLHSEVEELKERIKVLERITIEKENSLAREIESLRDR